MIRAFLVPELRYRANTSAEYAEYGERPTAL
jgi:hypothetical protein